MSIKDCGGSAGFALLLETAAALKKWLATVLAGGAGRVIKGTLAHDEPETRVVSFHDGDGNGKCKVEMVVEA